ncbi:gamma-glutamyl-gamma-aminobutyrate hydrolase family protein [Fodinicola feengrottensis]|uniref:Gamma-glutamyl-gamma-aminobutyrate hydrolase n=1 Tax=Fodinicola feengrottensis TaxID=435914 RepID=A0ABN2HMU8_9ACTN|nr:gamma-glutamyl-gamma-aminobutyrate hydrolase family protein [Fodinicola feengrottensis]
MSGPTIGITSYVEQASWGVWRTSAALIPYAYVEKVRTAGGVPLIVPPVYDDAEAVLSRLDALVLAGGADVDPAMYEMVAHPETVGLRPDRDESELALLAVAYARDLPVLGICRGMQLMCVAAGGKLEQHLPDVVGHEGHRPEPGVYGSHAVSLVPDSVLGRLLGDELQVPSYHHQAAAEVGSLTVSGKADDGTVEAVEDPSHTFALGVQWHPEVSADDRLFRELVRVAALSESTESGRRVII